MKNFKKLLFSFSFLCTISASPNFAVDVLGESEALQKRGFKRHHPQKNSVRNTSTYRKKNKKIRTRSTISKDAIENFKELEAFISDNTQPSEKKLFLN